MALVIIQVLQVRISRVYTICNYGYAIAVDVLCVSVRV